MESDSRRTRKSAPVKNAVFLGAVHKDRTRIRGFQESNNTSLYPIPNGDARCHSPNISLRSCDSRSRPARHSAMPTSARMSTPVRNCATSPRYRTRHRSRQESIPDHDRSRSTTSSTSSKRRYHPDYDPYIEIRRAKERLERYRTKDDWNADMLLSDDADEDLLRYEAKLKRRIAERGEPSEPIELERRQMELLRRQKDIDMGKVTERYAEYVLSIPKPDRGRHHPRTPNKFRKVSRRAWDGMIRKWRKHLHNFDDLSFEDSWRSLSSTFMTGPSTPSDSLSGVTSDVETENVAPINSAQLMAEISVACLTKDFGPTDALTASPTLRRANRASNFSRTEMRLVEEDEDETLHAKPVGRRMGSRSPLRPQRTNIPDEDDDTLSAMPNQKSMSPNTAGRMTRSRHSKRGQEIPLEALHSGLTNDMVELGRSSIPQKRTSAHLMRAHAAPPSKQETVDIKDLGDFPKLKSGPETGLASPSKRARRGILSMNGVQGLDV